LQEREVIRVGGNEVIKLDVRLIVATHKNLAEEVKKGNFREDLYFRIMGLPIELPPLRARGNDILILAKHFMNATSKENKLGTIILSKQAKDKLLRYHFPGNIRELKAIIELAAIMCSDNEIKADDITFNKAIRDEIFIAETKTLHEHNLDIIQYYLKKNNKDIRTTATVLGIGISTIYKMLKQKEITL
jgi:DNA-binding NtrC family response regulator